MKYVGQVKLGGRVLIRKLMLMLMAGERIRKESCGTDRRRKKILQVTGLDLPRTDHSQQVKLDCDTEYSRTDE